MLFISFQPFTDLGVVPDNGFLEALNVTNPVMMENIVQNTQNLNQPNFTQMMAGINHIPIRVALWRHNRTELG